MKLVGVIASIAIVLSGRVDAAPLYTLTDLGTLGGAYSIGFGINANKQVTGMSYVEPGTSIGMHHAFLYSAGAMADLGTLGGANSIGHSINDSGQIAGSAMAAAADPSLQQQFAFIYENGVMQAIVLGQGRAINQSGYVTGVALDNMGGGRAFIFDGITVTTIPTLAEPANGFAMGRGINLHAQVTGWSTPPGVSACFSQAFLYEVGALTDLGICGIGEAINDIGQIVGSSFMFGAFLYSNESTQPLGTLPGDSHSVAFDINNRGQIVGLSTIGGGPSRAFVYENGTMHDLNSLIDPSDPLFGVMTLNEATSINEAGDITGSGCLRTTSGDEECHAFIASRVVTAVPEPHTLGTLMLACIAFLFYRHHASKKVGRA